MPARTRFALGAVLAALALAAPAPAPAATGWRCSAGTLAGSILGQSIPGAVTAGSATADCTGSQASAPLSVPPLLDAGLLGASTAGDASKAIAVGGVADLRVRSLPDLGIELPPIEIPESLTRIVVPVLGVELDLTPAIEALLPDRRLPALDLVTVTAATAYAAGQCTDGVPKLAGAAVVGDVRIAGTQVAGGLVDQVLPLLDTQHIDLSDLDLSRVDLLGLSPGLVQGLLQPVLDGLPPLEVPATLARVKVTPGDQVLTDGGVVQRALRVEASIAGQSIADLTLGHAAVAADGVDCAPPRPAAPPAQPDASDLALACTKRDIVLIDVLPRGRRVKLIGAADERFAGRTVSIVFGATGRRVARALVNANGSFATTAPMPSERLRRTNRARYRAVLGRERSLNLKLMRRMVVDSVRSSGGRVRIRGRVVPPLGRPRRPIVVKRRVTCSRSEVVARVRPSRSGRFDVSVKAPAGQAAAVYRLQTEVRNASRGPKLYPTFTLPRAVDL